MKQKNLKQRNIIVQLRLHIFTRTLFLLVTMTPCGKTFQITQTLQQKCKKDASENKQYQNHSTEAVWIYTIIHLET